MSSKKQTASAAPKVQRSVIKSNKSNASVNMAVASVLAAEAGKFKKSKVLKNKKKDPWWKTTLKGAGQVAASLAPALLPFLLANHPPTRGALASAPASVQSAAGVSSVPFTSSSSLGNHAGLKSLRAKHDKNGVCGLRVVTMDLIGSDSGLGYSKGDVIFQYYLNPLDPVFAGTKFADYADIYTKYKVHSCVLVSETLTAASTAGAQSMAFFPDPLFDIASLSVEERLNATASQPGADTEAVWESAACHHLTIPGDPPLFIEPNGSDLRLTVDGRFNVIAAADIPAGAFANYYLLADVEYSVPTLEDKLSDAGVNAENTAGWSPGGDTYQPLFLADPLQTALDFLYQNLGGASFAWDAVANMGGATGTIAANGFRNLPPGIYSISTFMGVSNASEPLAVEVTADGLAYGVELIYTGWVTNTISATSASSTQYLYVPTGVPANLTSIVLFASADTFTDMIFRMTRMSAQNLPFDAFGLENPLFAASLQGQMRRRDIRIARLEQNGGLAPITPPKKHKPKPAPTPLSALPVTQSLLSGRQPPTTRKAGPAV
jgi:hypothetical protein